ncbi:hypothetical protein ACFY5H_21445 [Streptomyces sp. NPDC013012]|uniref:hypothetical protein n=1 Tax=Streptomyces sp. NPDC013012 TaxID=3364860 RepID=UPI00369F90C8
MPVQFNSGRWQLCCLATRSIVRLRQATTVFYAAHAPTLARSLEDALASKGHRSAQAEPAKPLPHPRVSASTYCDLIPTVGRFNEQFHVSALDEATGIGPWGIGISMKFLADCGLVEKISARGIYQSTLSAQEIARAWVIGRAEGLSALRADWQNLWFVRSARERLEQGSAPRVALRLKFLRQVRTRGHEKAVDRLLDLMIATGFLIEEPDGLVRWYDQAAPSSGGGAEEPTAQAGTGQHTTAEEPQTGEPAGDAGPSSRTGPDADTPRGSDQDEPTVPGPRREGESSTRPDSDVDVEELLSAHLGMGEVWHMNPDEAAALHDHVTGLVTVLSAVSARAQTSEAPLKAELLVPLWPLAAIAAMDRGDWLNTHRLIQQLGSAAPLRKESMNN